MVGVGGSCTRPAGMSCHEECYVALGGDVVCVWEDVELTGAVVWCGNQDARHVQRGSAAGDCVPASGLGRPAAAL